VEDYWNPQGRSINKAKESVECNKYNDISVISSGMQDNIACVF
jgi:hypothetical protein